MHILKYCSTLFSTCRSFENNLSTYRLLSYRKADSELPNVSPPHKHFRKEHSKLIPAVIPPMFLFHQLL